ncbi:hypothetical protein J1605_004767 [Eschrichtius robustus]|uniref:Uncharacterized protein n=1 Tax=Eschrichtius robustus TaxID=9764 RepID=A0AB34HG73_ESCRO|nr:hypothetical protein J1605_004767 [Eschrichtius robustus]
MRGEPAEAAAGVTLQQPEARPPDFPGLPPGQLWHTSPLQAVFTPPSPVLSLRSDRSPSLSSQPPPAPAVSAREGAPSVWKPFLLHSSLPLVQELSFCIGLTICQELRIPLHAC